jgi:hypothetical protein
MKLAQQTIPDYFSIADSTNSWYKEPTNTFNFIDNNSKTLIVTVGDSWTWGADMSANNNNDDYRLNNLYGRVIADELQSDWLNLGFSAKGNFWIATMVTELADIIDDLEYDKIYVVCTFTEVGRSTNTIYDRHINYINWFQNNIHTHEDFNKLFYYLNSECIEIIITALKKYNHVVLKVGTNFIDPVGFDKLNNSQILSTPWYKVLGLDDNAVAYTCNAGTDS